MRLKKIIRMFEDGNVCVTGLRGRGKDMLTANVCVRRKKPYVSNVDYGGKFNSFEPSALDCGGNTYRNFIDGDIKCYIYPYPDGTDIYISDVGIYFPAQYCNELNRHYGHMATFQALSRHLGDCNFHINVQNLNRAWDKIREQSDTYIMCMSCVVLFGVVFQRIRVYEKYDSCVARVPPFRVTCPILCTSATKNQYKLARQNYECSYGEVKSGILIYRNRSKYDTRIFKKLLEEGTT